MTTTSPMDPAELAAGLRAVLTAVESGAMVASATLRARLEGAVVALDLVAGGSVKGILKGLMDPDRPPT
jgi:hypothetical protein